MLKLTDLVMPIELPSGKVIEIREPLKREAQLLARKTQAIDLSDPEQVEKAEKLTDDFLCNLGFPKEELKKISARNHKKIIEHIMENATKK